MSGNVMDTGLMHAHAHTDIQKIDMTGGRGWRDEPDGGRKGSDWKRE